jgi:transcriptional regulator with XRE-family HTH domain
MTKRQTAEEKAIMRGFGERLRKLRRAHADQYGAEDHTRARWARRIGVSPALYGRWETGEYQPKVVDVLRICVLMRTDPNYLIAGVLSEYQPAWLYQALRADNPELLDAADYWQDQNEVYAIANRAFGNGESKPLRGRRSEGSASISTSTAPPAATVKRAKRLTHRR